MDTYRACKTRILYWSFIIVFIASMGFGASRPAIAFIVRIAPGGGIVAVSLLTTSFMVARASSSPIAGFLGDKNTRYREVFLRIFLLPAALSLALMYLYPIPYSLVLLMALWGFSSGFYWPTMQYVVSAVGGSTALGLYFGIAGGGLAAGYWLFGVLELQYTELLLVSVILFTITSTLSYVVFRGIRYCREIAYREVSVEQSRYQGKISILDVRGLLSAFSIFTLWVLVSSLVIGFAGGVMQEFLYVYVYEVHGISRGELGSVLALGSIFTIISSISAGYLADKIGIKLTLSATLLLASLGLGLLPISGIGFPLVALSVSSIMFARNAAMPLTRTIAIAGSREYAGTVIGVSNTISNIGSMVSPIVAGVLYSRYQGEVSLGFVTLEEEGLIYLVLSALSLLLAISSLKIREERKS